MKIETTIHCNKLRIKNLSITRENVWTNKVEEKATKPLEDLNSNTNQIFCQGILWRNIKFLLNLILLHPHCQLNKKSEMFINLLHSSSNLEWIKKI